jgi:glucose dehydrogenase
LLWNNDISTRDGTAGNGRGLSVGDGMAFAGQGDGTVTAFSLDTGKVVWKTLINTAHVPTYQPAVPVFWNHTVYTSLSGNDLGHVRGGIFAYDAKTGALKWTFWIVPFAGQPGSETWGDPKELDTGGGGNWTYGAIDPKLGLLYEPTGQPAPDFERTPGNNLYTDSIIALNLNTGKLKWYYQTTHHDEWDYDCASPPILWDHKIKGKLVHGMEVACKSGMVYELNRATGKPVLPVKETAPPNANSLDPVTKTFVAGWSKTQPIPVGDPIVPRCATADLVPGPAPDGKPYEYGCEFAYFGPDHFLAHAVAIGGAVNYEPSSYNAKLGYAYICAIVNMQSIKASPGAPSPLGAIAPALSGVVFGSNGGYNGTPIDPTKHILGGTFTALNVNNNRKVWQKEYYSDSGISCKSGSATTATGLVFTADMSGVIHAYDAKNGTELWRYEAPEGMVINSSPAIYSANGKEYVAFNANLGAKTGTSQVGKNTVMAFALP